MRDQEQLTEFKTKAKTLGFETKTDPDQYRDEDCIYQSKEQDCGLKRVSK